MLFRKEARTSFPRSNLAGGNGDLLGDYAILPGKGPENSAFTMLGEVTLMPGSSIGMHTHGENEEIYIVLSGEGTYVDNDGSENIIKPGDTTLTRKGEKHSLANNGGAPLTFLAIIATS